MVYTKYKQSCQENPTLKKGINYLMPVRFNGLDLDTVDHIDFILKQKSVVWEFTYPSDVASRRSESSDIVDVIWTEDRTWEFKENSDIWMDTRVYFTDTWQNPITPVVSFRMIDTLFEQAEDTDNTSGTTDTGNDTTDTTTDTTDTIDTTTDTTGDTTGVTGDGGDSGDGT